ncbi:MAG: hypothetical protein DWG80_05935 [Chloroflexi bacterium]|nr:hypothetical protein [Chloroflexota bacterium]
MTHLFPSRMFHVKHSSQPDATRRSGRSNRMFHVKHRRARFAGLLALVALFATGCASIQSPEGWAAPAEVADQMVVQSATGQVSLVDPATGQVAWVYPEDDSKDHAFYATPIIDGETVYLADYSGRITRLGVGGAAPEAAWVTELGAHVVATPAYAEGTLYVPTADGRVVLIETEAGLITSTIQTADRRIWGAPVLRGGTIYIGDLDNGQTVALDAASGDRVWEQEISGPTAADLVLDGELLLAGAFDQQLHALDVANGGQERWAFQGTGWFLGRPMVNSGVVYAATMNGFVYAIDRETGAQVWVVEVEDAQFRAAPVIQGGSLIVVARDGRVLSLNAANGNIAWEQDATTEGSVNANPLIIGTDIYLVTSRHELVRVDASRSGAFQTVPLTAVR